MAGIDINVVTINGRLVRDPIVKEVGIGVKIVNFTIASNKIKKEKDGTYGTDGHFFDCVIMGKAVAVAQFLSKGKQVSISGSLTQQRWSDNNGENRTRVVITCNEIQLLNSADIVAKSNFSKVEKEDAVFAETDSYDDIPF